MTVETVLKDVLVEVGLDVSEPQINGSSFEMRQMMGLMNEAGKDIARRAEWSRLSARLDVAAGLSSIALPQDFHRMAETGAVRIKTANFAPVRQVLAPQMWELLVARPSTQHHFHLSGGHIHFSPNVPIEGAQVRYVSKNWVHGAEHITQNGDELMIPESLLAKGTVWRWKRQKGLPFDDFQAEFEADLLTEIQADRGAV